MKRPLPNGIVLDDAEGQAPLLQRRAKELRLTTLAFLATHPDRTQEYVLVDPQEGAVIFAAANPEEAWAHLDMMALSRDLK